MARRFHLALAVDDVDRVVRDYSDRLGAPPVQLVPGAYALWRTPEVNLSVSRARGADVGAQLRHVGFEDASAAEKTTATDCTGLMWERFGPDHQDAEIAQIYRT